MKTLPVYECEICGGQYSNAEGALGCESQGKPEPWPVGLIYGDHRPGAFYEHCTFAVLRSCVDGHYRWGTAHACRDLCEVRLEGMQHLNRKAPHFLRMVAYLRSKGITPLVMRETEIIPLEADGGC